ncbi:hypothetical protein PVK06_021970 [Gossypium arboreum]|uniref:Uncharacterized protein n=1 Tax=Gossypium arboreum TaxID=29729 RepID=A0ABR0PS27_GOSAR|nr:hypothetical protein PVK06_021970 [Gossypium arboreum]
MMEELTSRSEIRKELERERRRLRDRQRRQSMSLEEKEKHLARRRRNYQLRRQRAEMARLNPPMSPIQLPLSNALTCVSVSDVSPQCNADVAVAADADAFLRTDHGQQERLMLDTGNAHSQPPFNITINVNFKKEIKHSVIMFLLVHCYGLLQQVWISLLIS